MSREDCLRTKDMLTGALINLEQKIIDRRAFLRDEYDKDPAATDDWEKNIVICLALQENDPVLNELEELYRRTSLWIWKTVDKYNGKFSNPRYPALMAWVRL